MSLEPIPFVSGTNGQAESLDEEETGRRWRTPAPEERIGEVRFSLWKTEAPLPAKPPRFSSTFFVAGILGSFGFIALGGWVAGRIRQGDFLLGQLFAIAVFVAIYGGALVAVIASRRTKRPMGEAMPPPEGVPSRAVACLASVRHRGRCVGWLWFEGDLMTFRGAGFDFRLTRDDFRTKGPLLKAFRGGAAPSLQRPKGVSEYRLFLRPGAISGGIFALDRSLWKALEPDFAVWESGALSREPSLFPPIRPVPTVPARLRWASFVVPPLLMSLLLGFARLVLPLEPTNGRPPPSPWDLALAGAAFGLMWPVLLWTSDHAAKVYAREADRAARQKSP